MDRNERATNLAHAGLLPPWALPTLHMLGWRAAPTHTLDEVIVELQQHPVGRQLLHQLAGPLGVTQRNAESALEPGHVPEVAEARGAMSGRFYELVGHSFAPEHCRVCSTLDDCLLWSRTGKSSPPLDSMSQPDRDAWHLLLKDAALQGYVTMLIAATERFEARRADALATTAKLAEPGLQRALIELLLKRFNL